MSSMIENFDSLARLLLEALLNTLWQGMLIAALVWLLLRLVNRASATTRHAVWLVTLLTIGTLPFLAIIANRPQETAPATPVRSEPSKPAAQSATPAPVNQSDSVEADPASFDSVIARLSATAKQEKTSAPPQTQEQNPTQGQFEDLAVASTVEATPATPMAAPKTSDFPRAEAPTLRGRARTFAARIFSGRAPLALIGLWLALSALMSWRVARSYRAVFHLRRSLEPASSEHNGRVERLASLFGIKRPVRTFTSGQVVMPMTIGSLKPLIVLPADLAEELSQSEFESVIAHELAHIKRWDYLTNMLQRVAQSYLFFHPAVWFICKQLTIERELACDDWAVKTCEPRRYASCLTKLVEALNESKPHMAVRVAATGIGGIVFGKNVISRRVEMILNRDRNATTAVSKPAMLYAIGLVVMFVAVCSLISPVIAVPLGQNPAKQLKKENKAVAPAKSQEFPPLPAVPPAPPAPPAPADLIEPPDVAVLPDVPDIPEPPAPPLPPATNLAQSISGVTGGVSGGVPGGVPGGVSGAVALQPAPSDLALLAPEAYSAVTLAAQGPSDKRTEPAIPEAELISLLVDIVKRDADPNVRNEALQGLYRIRTDAGINALIQLYDGISDVKVKGEIIRYMLRREGRDGKVDNSKAIAKLTAIAKSEQNAELRNKAISYLGNIKGDEGANILIQIYDTLQDQKMKQYIIRSLAHNGGRKAVDKLVLIAKNDSDPVVRQYAIRSLYNVDNKRYLELDRSRVGMAEPKFFFAPDHRPSLAPFVFKYKGEPFELDAKKWEEWQKDWMKNWEERNEKIREMIEKIEIDGKKLRIEIPEIELQIKDLQDKIKLGYGFNNISTVEGQLRLQLAHVEAQIAAMRSKYSDTHPKMVETRYLRDALERQLNDVRSIRNAATRPGAKRAGNLTTSPAPAAAPKVAVSASSL